MTILTFRRIHNHDSCSPEAGMALNRQKVLGAIALLQAVGNPFSKEAVDALAFPHHGVRGRTYCDHDAACSEAYAEAQRMVAA